MSTTTYTDVRYRVEDAVAHIQLHRPEALNAWTPAMGAELLDAVRRAATDDAVRAVLITGAGRAFCAGADVKNQRELTPDGDPDLTSRLREVYNPIILEIRGARKPFVAAVQGACAGLGVSLALSCDLLLAAEDAYLLLAFVRIGVMPDAGATAFLAERVGLARAAELCMLGEKLPAAKAERWGLVNAVHPAEELQSAAEGLARRLASAPTVALGNMKRALSTAAQRGLADQLELEATLQQEHGATADYHEGRSAFAEKRKAVFQGR
ncbi:2-(1,2-epoxy-1,2-dihydrophenyl)acetyl-CoA isomerase PaaG [Pseudonocardia halophobica]|uniref:2-(1,2-epoxy-1,2-dihydrophenyl)acetyl-CoA isomerase n=1 Tax=Pseudonocardia halophobica TaxID=29401 RepID=A0A9W6KZ73_9PSEU|nr:enoyl-CoA hydratase-related protein [Pseudonocardia halophobica]GLL09840.1 2-(1,2-epoxy-1,2-dihydrophenyl)acetyl-CoA isomerase [Pseudonocardia halophobica]